MNEFIKKLSLNDKKSLSQKALKTCEEVGELAKVILPFDSADGTNHRFVDKNRVLEEIADVYLTNISIAYSLGFTDEEINEMINLKSLKWSEIQSIEDGVKFPLPFEIHITVNATEMRDTSLFGHTPKLKKFDIDSFKSSCILIGVKPIVLDLEINKTDNIQDVMTSSKHIGDNRSVLDECDRISKRLTEYGFDVIRTKVETVPWHPAAPVHFDGLKLPNDCYFESHIGIIITPDQKEDLEKLVSTEINNQKCLGEYLNFKLKGVSKLSQNFFKKSKNGEKFVNMLTYRSYNTGSHEFKTDVDCIKEVIKLGGFEFEKVEVEFCIYDTNISHDNKWLKV